MKTIGIIIPYAFPETGAASMRAHAFAMALQTRGYNPIIFAPEKGLAPNQTPYQIIRFKKKIMLGKLFQEYDVQLVIASTPPADLGMAALIFAKLQRIPLFADIRDPWVFDKQAVGLIKPKTLKFAIQKMIEKWFYTFADERFVVTAWTAALFENGLGIPATQFKLIPNGVQTEFFDTKEKNSNIRNKIRTKLGIPKKSIVFLFLGSVWRNIPEFIRQIKPTLLEKNAFLLIVGNTDNQSTRHMMEKINQVIEGEELRERVRLSLNVQAQEIPGYLHTSDIGVNIIGESLQYSVTVKTYEYAYAKLPILSIGPKEGALAQFHRTLKSGYYCNTWEEFNAKANSIIKNLSEQKKLASQDSKFVGEHFSRSKWSDKVVDIVDSHLNNSLIIKK
ncbi:MAG: glycosyltransferase [Candidatus Iainarchaeum archaeon]|uniref:Glycosyltransferase n=1 Tax=Candidatus Iainarchaeum sp. TaxID=3101447 RepID=A0A7T9DKR7_9ARCH|nr:MAG: glycosyltransferase [Candidatus Diapherotrites archaeon]